MKLSLFNTIKITIATIVAILIAEALGLEFTISAGTVAILTIAPTKKETIKTANSRFLAFVTALIISYIAYSIVGYDIKGFAIYLFCFILVCQSKQWHSAMAVNSVLMSHFITFGEMSVFSIGNEFLLFIIGVSTGILANMHLRKNQDYMDEMKKETELMIQNILLRMSQRVLDKDLGGYNGECFENLNQSITKAKNVAKNNYMNQIRSKDSRDIDYIKMRERQAFMLINMYKRLVVLRTRPITAKKIAEYLEYVSFNFNQDEKMESMIEKFQRLNLEFKETPLPIKRKEFEDRAHLFAMMRDMEEFLQLKLEYMENTSKF